MDLYEIEGKALLRRYGIKTDNSVLYDPKGNLDKFTYPCVAKGQILSGKRGKAGAVKFANSPEELKKAAEEIMKIEINGKHMQAVAVVDKLSIAKEFYLGLTLDTKNRELLLIFTPYGGMEIEELAKESPDKLLYLSCTKGFDREAFEKAISPFSLDDSISCQLIETAGKLVKACFGLDATTIEINPLAVLTSGELMAIDSKVVIDDNAVYRQENCCLLTREEKQKTKAEFEAEAAGLVYVELDRDGDIGLIAGGAGIGMATVDTITYYGGKAYNFLDLGGGVTAEKMYHAMHLLLVNPQVKRILVNVFGGINNCAVMAEGIERAYKEVGNSKPVVVKSRGFNQEEGWEIYKRLGFKQIKFGTTDEAVKLLMEEAGK